jgi:hypothetical protein
MRQLPTTCSTGASARPSKVVVAIITPALASPLITSQAPSASISTCTAWRTVRVSAAIATVRAAVGCCSAVTSAFLRRQRATRASVMPSVCATSAF